MGRTRFVRTAVIALLVLGTALAAAPGGAGADGGSHPPRPARLPIVFVHGQFGSAQQFQSQAMRFTSNGYPQDLLFAFEYDTGQPTNPIADLDAFVDDVLAETGAPQVLAIGHSRGTGVWTTYLATPTSAAKVAKYVNIDGASPAALPGGVPTIGIWGEWNSAGSPYNRRGGADAQIGPDPAANFHFPDKSHTEVATSPEAFARMYEFLTGSAPRTTDVTTDRSPWVSVAGRAVLFPENLGYAGAKVQVWRVDGRTGRRIWRRPSYQTTVDGTGEWGPVWLSTRAHYEMTIVAPDGSAHHFYQEPFLHDDHLVRLQTGLQGGLLDLITPDSDATTNLVILRMRELWGDQGAGSDRVLIDGTDVVLPATTPRSGVNLALFVHDDGLDGVTDLGKGELPPFDALPFLAAVDVSIPASPGGGDTVRITEVPRGGGDPAVVNVRSWPSTDHLVSVQLRDHEQPDRRGWPHR